MNKLIAAIAVLALGVSGYLFLQAHPLAGGQLYNFQPQKFTSTVQIGTKGTEQTFVSEGTCNLSQSSAGSHAATSSKEYFCAVTGVQSGDSVFVSLPPGAGAYTSGSNSGFGGFLVNSAYATTSDAIGVQLYNGTGAATTSATQATTSVHYFITR